MKYKQIPKQEIIEKAVAALEHNGMKVVVVKTKEEVKQVVQDLIPKGSEVMTMTSETLRETGVDDLVNESGDYVPLKKKLYSMDRATQNQEMQALGAAPSYAVGSVHAITTSGEVIIASNTGSQLPAYAYGSEQVIWVVGAHKIVESLTEGMARIKEYVLPLESERAKKAYGVPGSNISKLLIISREVKADRIKIVLVNEVLGF